METSVLKNCAFVTDQYRRSQEFNVFSVFYINSGPKRDSKRSHILTTDSKNTSHVDSAKLCNDL